MQQAVIALIVLVVGVVLGSFFKPTPEQMRPLLPPTGGGPVDSGHDHHH